MGDLAMNVLSSVMDDVHDDPWSYRDQVILAPMVRVGTLPMRILARHYGATCVYTDEIIDRKIPHTLRTVVVHGSRSFVEYRLPSKNAKQVQSTTVFATYAGERVSLQIGTSDAVNALAAASHVERDVRAIDVNMGCPKTFSTQAGMGSDLLRKPDLIHDILTTLKRNLNVPVTCKIRVLECPRETLELCRRIESCGVAAVGVHARFIADRDRYRCMPDRVTPISDALNIPVIFNGDIFHYDDIARVKAHTGASRSLPSLIFHISVMIARGAQWNASIFRAAGALPVWDVMNSYMSVARAVNNQYSNTKYTVLAMKATHIGKRSGLPHDLLSRTRNYEDLQRDVDILAEDVSLSGPYHPPCQLLDRIDQCQTGSPVKKARLK